MTTDLEQTCQELIKQWRAPEYNQNRDAELPIIERMEAIMQKTKAEQGYQGWTNYETWNVKLWLDNEQGTQEVQGEWLKQAKAITKTQDYWTEDEKTRFHLADMVRDFVKECTPGIGASMYSDLLGSAIDNVDFQEIADAIIADS